MSHLQIFKNLKTGLIEAFDPDEFERVGLPGMELVTIELDDEPSLTNAVFPNWWGDAEEREEYISQWSDIAHDEEGNRYNVIYEFPAVKGEEPDDDEWPWSEVSYISKINML